MMSGQVMYRSDPVFVLCLKYSGRTNGGLCNQRHEEFVEICISLCPRVWNMRHDIQDSNSDVIFGISSADEE